MEKHPAGSVGRAYDSQPRACEFKPHAVCTDFFNNKYIKLKMGEKAKAGTEDQRKKKNPKTKTKKQEESKDRRTPLCSLGRGVLEKLFGVGAVSGKGGRKETAR